MTSSNLKYLSKPYFSKSSLQIPLIYNYRDYVSNI
jgi:hypothetical protein